MLSIQFWLILAVSTIAYPAWAEVASGNKAAVETEKTTNLIDCPDCKNPVSRRAILCPNCGCPGEAIQLAVHKEEEAARPKSVVTVISEQKQGSGAVIKDEEGMFVVFDTFLLAETDLLELRSVGDNSNIPYTSIQLLKNGGLIRLKIDSELVEALSISQSDTEATKYFDADGFLTAPEVAVLSLDPQGRCNGINVGKSIIPLNSKSNWKAVQPRELRKQINELARMKAEKAAGLSPNSKIPPSDWLTSYFAKLSESLTR